MEVSKLGRDGEESELPRILLHKQCKWLKPLHQFLQRRESKSTLREIRVSGRAQWARVKLGRLNLL
jgi:hypothetical protein